jgi:hypothetical protein
MRGKVWWTRWSALGATLALALPLAWGRADERPGRCYRFVYDPSEFNRAEVEALAEVGEERCRSLEGVLGSAPAEAIPVYLKAGQGISSTLPHKNKAIDLYFARPIHGVEAPLIHETTHILADSPHAILIEGLATAMEERVGTLRTHPTYGIGLDDWMAALRCADRLYPLSEWETRDWRAGPWENNIIAYVQSGSFIRFLMDRYGTDAVVKTLQYTRRTRKASLDRVLQERLGQSLESLEKEWVDSVAEQAWGSDVDGLCRALKEGKVQPFLGQKLR